MDDKSSSYWSGNSSGGDYGADSGSSSYWSGNSNGGLESLDLNLGDYGYDTSPGGNFDLGMVDLDVGKVDPAALDLSASSWTDVKNMLSKLGSKSLDLLKKTYTKDGAIDWRSVISTGAGFLSASGIMSNKGSPQPRGYQGKIPSYTAVRAPVAGAFAPAKAGDPNRQYFSDTIYATPDKLAAAQTDTQKQAQGLATLNAPPVEKLAAGGLPGLKAGTYLRGGTDGMADELSTSIDNGQPAALSHGEFVIPADVVSHLGNGNSEAGAKRLYAMMDKVRDARTGTKQQGKQINPNKYIPA